MNIITRIKQNKKFKEKYTYNFLSTLSFWKIFVIWVLIIIFFALIYFMLGNEHSHLLNIVEDSNVESFSDSLYFSLVSATTTGYGDIVPIGYFKFISTFELVIGLLILALVTSKLVSIKQETIMDDLYEISFNDKINSLRSALLLFRQKINKFRYMIEDKEFRKRDLAAVDALLIGFSDDINEIINLLNRQFKNNFIKKLNNTQIELLFNSTISSFKRLFQFLDELSSTRIKYQDDIILTHIKNLYSQFKRFKKSLNKFNSDENVVKTDELLEKINDFINNKKENNKK